MIRNHFMKSRGDLSASDIGRPIPRRRRRSGGDSTRCRPNGKVRAAVPSPVETSGAAEPSPPRRFFFVHVQKTAGTALFQRLRNQFGTDGVYPNDSDGDLIVVAPQIMVPQLLERWAVRRDEIRVVSGHFPLCTV